MLTLKKELFAQIIGHCKNELPDEACGILAGKNDTVEKVYEVTNVDKSPENFEMDSREQIKIGKEIRSVDLEMVGMYHSHVASEAEPSAKDVKLAYDPDARYCIVTLKDKTNPRMRAFRIKEGKITEEEVNIK